MPVWNNCHDYINFNFPLPTFPGNLATPYTYDEEKEVLLYDGADLYVHSVEDVLDEKKKKLHTLIVLGSIEPEYLKAVNK